MTVTWVQWIISEFPIRLIDPNVVTLPKWMFPKIVVPPFHTPKWSFLNFNRKTHGCWVPLFLETPKCRKTIHTFGPQNPSEMKVLSPPNMGYNLQPLQIEEGWVPMVHWVSEIRHPYTFLDIKIQIYTLNKNTSPVQKPPTQKTTPFMWTSPQGGPLPVICIYTYGFTTPTNGEK